MLNRRYYLVKNCIMLFRSNGIANKQAISLENYKGLVHGDEIVNDRMTMYIFVKLKNDGMRSKKFRSLNAIII